MISLITEAFALASMVIKIYTAFLKNKNDLQQKYLVTREEFDALVMAALDQLRKQAAIDSALAQSVETKMDS